MPDKLVIKQYSPDKPKILVETAIYRVSKTRNCRQKPLTEPYWVIKELIVSSL
ncbi:MAG: hypothetical protein V7K67_00190 [Nostoc sp.]